MSKHPLERATVDSLFEDHLDFFLDGFTLRSPDYKRMLRRRAS